VLTQTNYGPTGCLTSATKTINVLQGFEEGYSVLLHTATFSPSYADSVSLFWQPAPYAKQYSILLNQQEIAQLTDTSYTHVSPNFPAVYTIQAENICGDKALSNKGKLIELSVSLTEDNSTAIVTWTPYEQWQSGVNSYEVQRLEDGVFSTLGTLNNASTFSDYNFAATSVAKQCYRIKAQQKNGNWHSYSNSVWVPLAPTVWVPSAFSPNSDGLNDVFNLVAQGATAIEYTIYNRWGELIYSGNNWDGQNAPQGVYAYTATITFATGNKTNLKGMVSLLR
jgi:gliding motility-associated-like protein